MARTRSRDLSVRKRSLAILPRHASNLGPRHRLLDGRGLRSQLPAFGRWSLQLEYDREKTSMTSEQKLSDQTLTSSGHARRRFLERTALITAGTSLAAVLHGASEATAQQKSSSCADARAPMQEVGGKVAFITGGSSGIGLGIARAFAAAGMKVAIGYRTEKHLHEAMALFDKSAEQVHAIKIDVTDRLAVAKAAEKVVKAFGKVHVLVNNAGVAQYGPLSTATYDDWDFQMNVNLDGVFNGIKSFLPHIQAHGEGGQVITTSSIRGLSTGANSGIYSATKYAVVGLMEALRPELAAANIGVSAFCPGLVMSNIQESRRNRPADLSNTAQRIDPQSEAKGRELLHDPQRAMDPLDAGRLVLRGMRNNDLYILTHPEYEKTLRERNEAIIASIPRDMQPTKASMAMVESARPSFYANERDRRQCRSTAERTR